MEVEVVTVKQMEEFDRLLLENREMKRFVRKALSSVLTKARAAVAKDAKSQIGYDPRQSYRAVKRMVYRRILGGNVSILQSRKASALRIDVQRDRKLVPGQRGGNRKKRSERTNQLDSYFGKDRGFILRFLNSGTAERVAYNYGNARRGAISGRNWFGQSSLQAMNHAAESFCRMIDEEIERINKEYNNG